ncbi:MAG: hypothetical protein A2X76_01440 [Lysobacterales bacterium GWF1_69_6]|nr:MAG: hypothetical protein A2X76_01440 [Xanthomonadales bacterium GWF1_69_6]
MSTDAATRLQARLSDAEIRQLAAEHVGAELYDTEARSRPTAVILAGQSGAGKSTLASDLAEELDRKGGYIAVDADLMRARLPYYPEVSGADVAAETQIDAGRLAQAVRHEAVEARRNILVDGTLRDPEAALKMVQELRGAGYEVEVHAIAVNDQISYERATARHEHDVAEGGAGRFVPTQWHDESFVGSANSIRRLEFAGAVDRIAVYNRLADKIHDQAPEPGKHTAAEAFERARHQLTDYERVNLAQRWDEISESMERRGAAEFEQDRIQLRFERAHYTLRTSPQAAESYDHQYPGLESQRSKDLAERYGQRLEEAFRAGSRDQAREMPELSVAFAAQAAAYRAGQENPALQPVADKIQDRIANALRTGEGLKTVQLRANPSTERHEPAQDLAR